VSESDSWSEHEDAVPALAAAVEPPPVAEQMRAATRSLRNHLSLVRDVTDEGARSTG
jgi:hypothetical protein